MTETRALREIVTHKDKAIEALELRVKKLESIVRDYQGVIKQYDDVRRMLSMSGDDPADYIDPIVGDIDGTQENH